MKRISLQIIKDEHASLAAMLKSIRMMVARGPQDQPEKYFDVLRAMLFYIDEFPERQHHPKETNILFPLVVQCDPGVKDTIDQLDREHEAGQKWVREIQHLLLAWEILGEERCSKFTEACSKYIDFYLAHMRLEETALLPVAERELSDEQWSVLDKAFASNRDPLHPAHASDPRYSRLVTRIVLHAPAPIGVGHS